MSLKDKVGVENLQLNYAITLTDTYTIYKVAKILFKRRHDGLSWNASISFYW